MAKNSPVFNTTKLTQYMHHIDGFEKVLHIAHHEWHGIRHATGFCPGHKLLIDSEEPIEPAQLQRIEEWIEINKIERIVFQGYSIIADKLAVNLRSKFGDTIRFFVITHVTTAQFDNVFEIKMQNTVLTRKKYGVFSKIASVKPKFSGTFEDYWPHTIINFAPNIIQGTFPKVLNGVEVLSPLELGWRKNLYTNIFASHLAENVDRVKVTFFPPGIESIFDISKLRYVGLLRGPDLFAEMANSSAVVMATLAECQPMTQLEAFAVGTPALTGPLNMSEYADDELIRLCTASALDNPALLARDIERLIDLVKTDPDHMDGLIQQHLLRRNKDAAERYASFLDL
ncbi:MAG: hypothetical protein C0606_13795 [Hyphomicrobiales bacterium]|nr:MAG: hypothetical protein C0606_13795 [Hyphomicrobiales bacterium]